MPRPKKPAAEKLDQVVHVKLSRRALDALNARAYREGLTPALVARMAVYHWVFEHDEVAEGR